jgi:acetolactate synthase-1/2/3 large subunit
MGRVSGAHLLVRALKQHGIEKIFGLCGDHVNAIFNACLEEGVQVIDVRHESAAVHMADGLARVTGRPAVSVVTGGPGHTNAVTGLATAWKASSPVIAISGIYDLSLSGRGAFQEIDQLNIVRPITKWSYLVLEPSQVPWALASAYREAISGRPGPVHLSIPAAVSDALVEEQSVEIPAPFQPAVHPVPQKLIETALDMLRGERPVVIAGSGVFWSQAAGVLRQFIEMSRLPCFTIGLGRGALSDEHPLCFGYADTVLNSVAKEIGNADVVLLIGKRIDFRLGFGRLFDPAAALIQVDIHEAELGRNRPAQLRIHGDARIVLEQLVSSAASLSFGKTAAWFEHLRDVRQKAIEARRPEENSDAVPIHPLRLIKEVREMFNGDVIWSIDGGDFAQWCRMALPARKPGHWLRLGPLGTLGAAIPFGIAAKLANPETPVVILTGDGGIGFHAWEIHTALRFNIPIVIVVGNDCGWGMERAYQAAFYNKTIGVELGPVRHDRVVAAMGGHAEHVERPEELRPALERAVKSGKAACVNVMIQGVPSPLTQTNIARHQREKE